jgi:hypothetical protein
VFKKAKAEGKRASLVKDKLFIEGKIFEIGGADSNHQMEITSEPSKGASRK